MSTLHRVVSVTLALAGCTSSSESLRTEAAPPPAAAAVKTKMDLPGIGIEAEDGKIFQGVYDAASKTVNVTTRIQQGPIYASDNVPGTDIPGLAVTGDLGNKLRTLELVTGPWEASFEAQTRVLGWLSAFYVSIREAAKAAPVIESATEADLPPRSLTNSHCAKLKDVAVLFHQRTGVELTQQVPPSGDFFVCQRKRAKDFAPQANYGVKLSAFVDGGIAKDFGGRPRRKVKLASGKTGTSGPGCVLGPKNRTALMQSTQMSLEPTDSAAFCEAQGIYTTEKCGAPFTQPAFPCFPRCMMGQLCYGLATNSIWFDGGAEPADAIVCNADDQACQATVRQSYQANFPAAYAPDADRSGWTAEQQLALRALLIINRCGAWVNSLGTAGVSDPCFQKGFWQKQVMGALPKARFDEFEGHLPDGFSSAGGLGWGDVSMNPPFTELSSYRDQVCDSALLLGETARGFCRESVEASGLDHDMGGKEIDLFRIQGELALVVESRHATLYVAGGYLGVRGEDGVVTYDPEALADTINYVRTLNGVPAE